VLTDGNGGQLLMTFQGASDTISRISYSSGALFTLAGSTEQQPTATDEIVISSASSLVATTASGDRIWHGVVSSDAKACRFHVARASTLVGVPWFCEAFTPQVTAPAVITNPVFGASWSVGKFNSISSSSYYQGYFVNSSGGLVWISVSGVPASVACGPNTWNAYSSTAPGQITSPPELQGSLGHVAWPHILMSTQTAGYKGYVGDLIDWYTSVPAGSNFGDGFGSDSGWWLYGVMLWPNPSLTAPTIA